MRCPLNKSFTRTLGAAALLLGLSLPVLAKDKIVIGEQNWTGAIAIQNILGEVIKSRFDGEVSYLAGDVPVLFAAEMARSLVGHYLGAVSGGALYRKASFLLDSVGTQVLPDWFSIEERPFLARGFRSASFDADGVALTRPLRAAA